MEMIVKSMSLRDLTAWKTLAMDHPRNIVDDWLLC